MTSEPAEPSAEPRYRHVPECEHNHAEDVVELAASAGLELDPWQQADLAAMLGEDEAGDWAAKIAIEIVPRQNGKGGITEARQLGGLFLFGESVQTHTAHNFNTATAAFRRLLELIQSSPDLDRQVHKVRLGPPDGPSIELRTGEKIRYLARAGGSGRGLTGQAVYLDEAMILDPVVVDSIIPTLSAVPNAQVVVTSTPPIDDIRSDALRQLMRIGRKGSPTQSYVEWSAAGNEFFDLGDDAQAAFLDDEANWERANPALDIRVQRSFVRDTERALMTPRSFARERLGIAYIPATADAYALANWPQCATEDDVTMDDAAQFAIDVAPGSTSSAIGVAAMLGEKRVVYVAAAGSGTGWLIDRLAQLMAEQDCRTDVIVDPAGPAGALLSDLERAGIEYHKVTEREHAQGCEGFAADVEDGQVVHVSQPELDAAMRGATRRKRGDLWLWARENTDIDISPLVAVTLARWGHLRPAPITTAPTIHVLKGATV